MAEAIARRLLDEGVLGTAPGGDREVFVASAGVSAGEGHPTTPETIEALSRMGILFDGRSLRLTAEMIRRADLVLCMTESHAQAARSLVAGDPDALARIALVDPTGDIEDPIGLGQEAYDRLARRLSRVLPSRLQELLQP